ncbi:MAG: alcohol dehydrogenase catalytic domain-containing protein [Aliidongia sp.]
MLQVKACGVNFPDVLIIQDLYQFKPPRPFAPGSEVAGIITAVGEGVTAFKPGDKVFGSTGWGGMSERVAVAAARCNPMPDGMPFDEAAAFLMTYGTSHHALKDRAKLQPGETLLVLGAAGGVGPGRGRTRQGSRRPCDRRGVVAGEARFRQGTWRR